MTDDSSHDEADAESSTGNPVLFLVVCTLVVANYWDFKLRGRHWGHLGLCDQEEGFFHVLKDVEDSLGQGDGRLEGGRVGLIVVHNLHRGHKVATRQGGLWRRPQTSETRVNILISISYMLIVWIFNKDCIVLRSFECYHFKTSTVNKALLNQSRIY